jgi:hypothetical protein
MQIKGIRVPGARASNGKIETLKLKNPEQQDFATSR